MQSRSLIISSAAATHMVHVGIQKCSSVLLCITSLTITDAQGLPFLQSSERALYSDGDAGWSTHAAARGS